MNCLLCGVGGQGTVLASKLLAQAAIDKGISVKTAESCKKFKLFKRGRYSCCKYKAGNANNCKSWTSL